MIGIAKVVEKTKYDHLCSLCNKKVNKGELAIKIVKRIPRPLHSLRSRYYHFSCAIKSVNPFIESALLQYAYELKTRIGEMTKLIEMIESENERIKTTTYI